MENQEQALRQELAQLQQELQSPDVYGQVIMPSWPAARGEDSSKLSSFLMRQKNLSRQLDEAQKLSVGDDGELVELAKKGNRGFGG